MCNKNLANNPYHKQKMKLFFVVRANGCLSLYQPCDGVADGPGYTLAFAQCHLGMAPVLLTLQRIYGER